jgi:hypothetical protein
MPVPQLNRRLLPFFIGVPLAWAVVLIFHPAPDPDHIHGSLEDEVTQWLVVDCLTLIFIGLMGAALSCWCVTWLGRQPRSAGSR